MLEKDESSQAEWQREARRLELQGKTEQAEQIRRELLGAAPVPWTIADRATFATLRTRALAEGQRDKAAQQLLFEYALTYDVPRLFEMLVEAGFRHARNPEGGREFIWRSHYQPYHERRSTTLESQLRKHGVDFRNPLNEPPLMVAARVGRADLVAELLEVGADPEQRDTAGRNALEIALLAWLDAASPKPGPFAELVKRLSTEPTKVKVGSRMRKLDPRTMEWFLLHLLTPRFRQSLGLRGQVAGFTAPFLESLLAKFPDSVVMAHRKKRAYLSAMLSKNELHGSNAYNRRIFVRVGHGLYLPNPALEIARGDTWIPLFKCLELDHLFEAMSAEGTTADRWLRKLEAQTRADLGTVSEEQ